MKAEPIEKIDIGILDGKISFIIQSPGDKIFCFVVGPNSATQIADAIRQKLEQITHGTH